MLDFTSALYLGLRHSSRSLQPWKQFTTGVPAALKEPSESQLVADALAHLQGCEHGVLGQSTFHLFWDLFGMVARRPTQIYIDAGLYPIARWGVVRAGVRGITVREFGHHDAKALRRLLKSDAGQQRPIIVTDGFCPACGKAAPLADYLEVARDHGGRLVLDDTQALGIFGVSPEQNAPYGHEGGGMLRRLGIAGPEILAISSLAKAFGVPAAVLSGSRATIEEFKKNSETRVHCSPISLPVIRATQHALYFNRERGDSARLRLARLVAHFRHRAEELNLRFSGGVFPVQTLSPRSLKNARCVHKQLLQRGVRAVLRRAAHDTGERITFVITARHNPEEIGQAIAALGDIDKNS
jgi:8-amino-7-oxononanoate synthase